MTSEKKRIGRAKISYKIGKETRTRIVSAELLDEWLAEYQRIDCPVKNVEYIDDVRSKD